LREFVNSEGLAVALAAKVAGALRARIEKDGRAALAVSGGTTPVRFFEALSEEILDWAAVTVTLVDDRCVPDLSPRSNARLVRDHLLHNAAAEAAFQPLLGIGVEQKIAALNLPFAAVVLGMGTDGHTASFFPGGDRLDEAFAGDHLIVTMSAPGADEPRVTLTLPVLMGADFVALHIEGAAKQAVLAAALAGDDAHEMPVRAVLRWGEGPAIFWCP
jgi:6-phosphogluconolactonase